MMLPFSRWLPAKLVIAVLHRELARGYADPARAARSIDLYLRPFGDDAGRAALVTHLQALSRESVTDLASPLSSIPMPTSLIWGDHDRVTPLSIGRRLQSAIPNATLEVIDGARHFTPEESPRKVAETIAALLARA